MIRPLEMSERSDFLTQSSRWSDLLRCLTVLPLHSSATGRILRRLALVGIHPVKHNRCCHKEAPLPVHARVQREWPDSSDPPSVLAARRSLPRLTRWRNKQYRLVGADPFRVCSSLGPGMR